MIELHNRAESQECRLHELAKVDKEKELKGPDRKMKQPPPEMVRIAGDITTSSSKQETITM